MRSDIDAILNKQVSRKEFLQHIGFALLAIMGISGLLKGLQSQSSTKPMGLGYGSSNYGGKK